MRCAERSVCWEPCCSGRGRAADARAAPDLDEELDMPTPDGGENGRQGISRRYFLRDSALTTVGAVMIDAASANSSSAEAAGIGGPPAFGPEPVSITLK